MSVLDGRTVGYVLSGMDGTKTTRCPAGDEPDFEIDEFRRRNPQTQILAADAALPGYLRRVPILGANLGRLYAADKLVGRAARHEMLIATGEDIGLPLAITLSLRGEATPLGVVYHGYYQGSRMLPATLSFALRHRRLAFLCLSTQVADLLHSEYDVPNERIFATGYGVDTEFYKPPTGPSLTADSPLVVSAGLSNRDYATLMAALAPGEARLHIAAASTWVQASAPVAGGRPGLVIESAGDYVGLRALYARADIVVVPLHETSKASGYAVIAEAMAMGKPVVTTRTRAVSDFITDGLDGLLTPPGDVAALRGALLKLLGDESLRRRLGDAARRRMADSFSLPLYCERLEAALLSLSGR